MKRFIVACARIVLFSVGYAKAGTWATLDYPGARDTQIQGIDGSRIVGQYWDSSSVVHNFLYDGTTWTTLDVPGFVNGVEGNNIVGHYTDWTTNGFVYDGTTLTTIHESGTTGTSINDIDKGNLVGMYTIDSSAYGFLYDGANWTTLYPPGASGWVTAYGIDGSNIVGMYGPKGEGFLYDGTTYTTLDMPGAVRTGVLGIDGSNLVGYYWGTSINYSTPINGFLYNGGTWTTLDMPGAGNTMITGISGNSLVGYYYNDYDNQHGFVYTVPEPATLLLLGVGGMLIKRRRKQL